MFRRKRTEHQKQLEMDLKARVSLEEFAEYKKLERNYNIKQFALYVFGFSGVLASGLMVGYTIPTVKKSKMLIHLVKELEVYKRDDELLEEAWNSMLDTGKAQLFKASDGTPLFKMVPVLDD